MTSSTEIEQLPTTTPYTSTWLNSQLLTYVLSTNRCDSLGQPQVANNTTSSTADAKPVAHTPLLLRGLLLRGLLLRGLLFRGLLFRGLLFRGLLLTMLTPLD